jgi:hypothetical protein
MKISIQSHPEGSIHPAASAIRDRDLNQKAKPRKTCHAGMTCVSTVSNSSSYISPESRFDHHGRLTPPSIVSVLPVM